jgi:hypothetical protein
MTHHHCDDPSHECPEPRCAPETYSLAQVARMFRCRPAKIKERALNGEFDYKVNGSGHFVFSRESILAHLDELAKRNNRIV